MRPNTWFLLVALATLLIAGCGSAEDEVRDTWDQYHHAMRTLDLAGVRSWLAAGTGAELDGPDAELALEFRSAMVPADPRVTAVEVSASRAVLSIEGVVEAQNMKGRVTLAKESGGWRILNEEWSVDLTASFVVPDVDLALLLSESPALRQTAEMAAHEEDVTAVAFTRDGHYLVSIGYNDKHLRLWDPESGQLLDDQAYENRPSDLALSPDGSAAYVVDAYGKITEWPLEAGTFGAPVELAGLAGRTPRLAVDPRGHRAVTTSWDDPAKLWDLDARRFVRALPKSDRMRGAAFSPTDDTVALGSNEDYFAVWDLTRLSWPVGGMKKHKVSKAAAQSDVYNVAFTPDGRRVATGHMDSSLSIWDVEKGKQLHNWYVPDCSATDVQFSACGTVLATAQQDGKVHLWETDSRKELSQLQAHVGSVKAVAFNPADGVTLASGGADGAIRIWRAGSPISR